MQKSESIGALAAALAKAQSQMKSARKDAANPFFKSHYADLSSIVDAIKVPLSENQIAYVQTTDIDEQGSVIVETTLIHASGEWIAGRLRMRPVKDDPQGVGSCISYARRYALQAIVGIAADEDDDGNAASGRTQKTEPARTPPTANRTPANTANGGIAPKGAASPTVPTPNNDYKFANVGTFVQWGKATLDLNPSDFWKKLSTLTQGKITGSGSIVDPAELPQLARLLSEAVAKEAK